MAEFIFPYELPENWQWETLGNVCSFIGGGTPNKKISKYWNGNIFWASVKDIKGDYLFNTIDRITEAGLKNSSANLCEVGDVILVTRISPATSIIAKIATAINQDLKIVKTSLQPQFLHYFFENFKNDLESMASGSTVKGITIEKLKKFPIPLPPLDEQKRIVAVIESLFEKLDAAKSIVQKVLDGYELRRAAILHKAFTGDLTKNFRADSGLTLDDWQEKKLGEVAITRAGYAFKSKKFTDKGKYQVIRMGNLYKGKLDLSKIPVYYPESELNEQILQRALVYSDDILITLTGTKYKRDYGYAVQIVKPENLLFNQRILCLTPKKIFSTYLLYYLQSNFFRNIFFSAETGGVNQGNVSSKFVENIFIKIPSLVEQKEIVRVLAGLLEKEQRTKEIAEKILSEIDLLKRTILARAFRGELGTKY